LKHIDAIALFTAVLAVVSYLQWQALRSTDKATHELAESALMQLSTLRPNLSFDVTVRPFDKDNKEISALPSNAIAFWQITPTFKNIGGTDARNVKGAARLLMANVDKALAPMDRINIPCPLPSPTFTPDSVNNIVTPGSAYSLLSPTVTIDQVRSASGEFAKEGILIEGYVEYNDIFPGTNLHHYIWCDLMFPNDIENSKFSFFNRGRSAD
jgi:hypothetical protein